MQMLHPSSLSHPSRAQFQFGSILIFEQNWSGRNSAASFLLLVSGHHWHHFWPGGSQSHGSSTPWGKNRWRSCFYRKHWVRSATNKPRWQVRMPKAPSAAAFHLHRRDISQRPSLFILNSPLLSFLNIWNWVFNWSTWAAISNIGGRTEALPWHNWITFPETTLSIAALKVTLRCTAKTPGSVKSPRHIAEPLSPQEPVTFTDPESKIIAPISPLNIDELVIPLRVSRIYTQQQNNNNESNTLVICIIVFRHALLLPAASRPSVSQAKSEMHLIYWSKYSTWQLGATLVQWKQRVWLTLMGWSVGAGRAK